MKQPKFVALGLLAALALFAGGAWLVRNAGAQTSAPPRIFQTEVRSWAGEDANSSTWQFTYLADGSLHVVTTADDGSCATITIPGGVLVSFIDEEGVINSQPGDDQPLTVCETFLTRANG